VITQEELNRRCKVIVAGFRDDIYKDQQLMAVGPMLDMLLAQQPAVDVVATVDRALLHWAKNRGLEIKEVSTDG
jgi:hypothetical protein